MARKTLPTLTEGELNIMEVIWKLKNGTIHEIIEALPKKNKPAYNTVLTFVGIMKKKGYLSHEKVGRAFVFSPLIEKSDARHTAVKQIVGNFFDNSPKELLLNIIESEKLSSDDIKDLINKIEESE